MIPLVGIRCGRTARVTSALAIVPPRRPRSSPPAGGLAGLLDEQGQRTPRGENTHRRAGEAQATRGRNEGPAWLPPRGRGQAGLTLRTAIPLLPFLGYPPYTLPGEELSCR